MIYMNVGYDSLLCLLLSFVCNCNNLEVITYLLRIHCAVFWFYQWLAPRWLICHMHIWHAFRTTLVYAGWIAVTGSTTQKVGYFVADDCEVIQIDRFTITHHSCERRLSQSWEIRTRVCCLQNCLEFRFRIALSLCWLKTLIISLVHLKLQTVHTHSTFSFFLQWALYLINRQEFS